MTYIKPSSVYTTSRAGHTTGGELRIRQQVGTGDAHQPTPPVVGVNAALAEDGDARIGIAVSIHLGPARRLRKVAKPRSHRMRFLMLLMAS